MTHKERQQAQTEQHAKIVKPVVIPDGIGGYTQRFVLCAPGEQISVGAITTMLQRCDYV